MYIVYKIQWFERNKIIFYKWQLLVHKYVTQVWMVKYIRNKYVQCFNQLQTNNKHLTVSGDQ